MLPPVVLYILLTLVRLDASDVSPCDRQTSCGCSDRARMHARIIGGQTVRTRAWSWVVSIRVRNRFQCAGSLIADSWVLTAAHCFSFVSPAGDTIIRVDPSAITIHAGSNHRNDESQSRRATTMRTHPQFDPATFINDIALIQVAAPFDMTDTTLGQICLPTPSADEYPPVNSSLVAVGWGRLSQHGPESITLQQVILQAFDHRQATCSSVIFDSVRQICAGVEDSAKDTCQGDSGGPVMVLTSSQQWVIVGMTSYGYGCALPEYSGVYTRVIAYLDWIEPLLNANNRSRYANSSDVLALYDDAEIQWATNSAPSHRASFLVLVGLLLV